jgi:O-antigen/teichoic acid export membrane protein
MHHEVGIALRNSVKLGLSLFCTWTVAFIVRFQLPRYMGASVYGEYNFADSFTAGFFTFLELGVDLYIQKEVSVRPKHASDFLGGILLLRGLLAVGVVAAILGILRVTHRSAEVQLASLLFAVAYFATCINATFGALLQSSTRVGRLAIANVIGKVAWGVGLLGCLWAKQPMVVFAVPLLASELLRSAMLVPAARAAVGLRLRVDLAKAKDVFVASLPYFIASAAIGVTMRVNVTVLEYMASDSREVGWLGAATNIGSLAMILYPLLQWIITPMLARARARSEEDVFAILRVSLEGLVVVAIPVSLLIGVGADVWVRLAFGADFAQASLALAAVAPQFVFTYTAMILSTGLIILDRQWTSTRNALLAMVLTPLLILSIVPVTRRLGEGGAAAGAAVSTVLSEIVVSISYLHHVGRRAIDRRTVSAVAKSAAIAGAVLVLDHFLRPVGPARLAIDMAVYSSLALGTGAVRLREARALLRLVRSRGR